MDPITAAISGGSSLAGNILGGIIGAEAARDTMKSNEAMFGANQEMQREFAKHGLRWKVEDAKAAGLHPLAALGAQTTSFSPITMGQSPDFSMANAVSQSGQDISRAIAATSTQEERQMRAYQVENARLEVEGKALDNSIRASQLQKMNGMSPAFPGSDNFIPGQGNSGLVREKPLERTVSAPGRPAQEAGWRPDVSYSRTDTGLTPMVPQGLSESLEDDILGKIMWRIRNQVVPNFTGRGAPPRSMLPKGADYWSWSRFDQEWQPKRYPKGVLYRANGY